MDLNKILEGQLLLNKDYEWQKYILDKFAKVNRNRFRFDSCFVSEFWERHRHVHRGELEIFAGSCNDNNTEDCSTNAGNNNTDNNNNNDSNNNSFYNNTIINVDKIVTYNFNIILKVHIQSTVVAYGCYHCGLCYLFQMPIIFPSLNISNIVITNLVREDDHRGTFPQVVSYLWKQSKLFWKSRAAKTKIIRVLTILIKV